MISSGAMVAVDGREDQGGRALDPRVLDVREVLRIAAERWRIIVAVAIAGVLVGLLLALVTTPRYRASALLDYDPTATDTVDQAGSRNTFKPFQANQEILATQLGLLSSESLARRVAEDLNLANDPAYGGSGPFAQRLERATAFVRSGISADVVKDSLLIRLTFTATDPQMTAKVVNAVASAFIATSLERHYSSLSYARKFLSDQLGNTRNALENSERALNDYAIHASLFRAPGEIVNGRQTEGRTLSDTDLSALESALNDARVKRIAAEAAFRNNAAATAADNASSAGALIQQRATLQAQYAQDSKLFKPAYPQMRTLQAQIDKLSALIDAEHQRLSTGQGSQLNAAYRAAKQAEDNLAANVASVKQQVQRERTTSIQYNILQREVDTNRELYDALLQRFKEVGVSGGITQSNLSLVDGGSVPKAPYRPNLVLNCLVGLIFGLVLGVGAAFVAHLVLDTIIDIADVREKLRLRVLGVIPRERDGVNLSESLSDRRSDVTEAYYSTLTAIRSLRADDRAAVLFVTSSRPAEGKSTSAYAIASITARLGVRVLLIDADLRRPTLTTMGPDERGFAHLLGSNDPVAEFVRPTGIDNLSVLPVGTFTDSPAELLSSARLPIVVGEARQGFDLVVLDGPPVLGLTDAPLLGAVADSTLVVVESRTTRIVSAQDMIRRLRDNGATILGVILTKVTKSGAGYGYNYDYYATTKRTGRRMTRFEPGNIFRTNQHGG